MNEHRRENYAGAVSSFAMRASCFCSWSSCRRSCLAPTVFSCWSASTPFRMPSSLVMTGSNFSSSFFSIVSPTASRMTFACSERSLSNFLSRRSSNLPNSAFKTAEVTGASGLFGIFSIDVAYAFTIVVGRKLSTEGWGGVKEASTLFVIGARVRSTASESGEPLRIATPPRRLEWLASSLFVRERVQYYQWPAPLDSNHQFVFGILPLLCCIFPGFCPQADLACPQ